MAEWNLWAGWAGMLLGLVSGAIIGLGFHKEAFAGGYTSFRRRMLRLGHVAFFALGMVNVLFALTLTSSSVVLGSPQIASACLAAGGFTMPAVCFLTAWKTPFRHVFPLPVILVLVPVLLLLEGMMQS
jgi:hypothetical protein